MKIITCFKVEEKTLSEKIQYTIKRIFPDKDEIYQLPHQLKKELDRLEIEEDNAAMEYLEQSIRGAKSIAVNNNKWNKGWKDNLNLYNRTKNTDMLAPLYSGKLPYLKLFRKLYKTEIRNAEEETCNTVEHQLNAELYDEVISRWIRKYYNNKNMISKEVYVIELGAGSCQHIPRLNKKLQPLCEKVKYIATDWSTTTEEICTKLKEYEDIDIKYMNINLLEDLGSIKLPRNSFIYTVNALEQLGNKVGPVIDWINKQSPRLVIHFEPITEVLEINDRYDQKSIEYIKARGYLDGLYAGLVTRQSKDDINIISCERTFISNAHHENNTFICWESKQLKKITEA